MKDSRPVQSAVAVAVTQTVYEVLKQTCPVSGTTS